MADATLHRIVRRAVVLSTIGALGTAGAITGLTEARPLAEAIVEAEAHAHLADLPTDAYSTRTKAVLLRYRGDASMAAAARYAVTRFPDKAPAIIKAHGIESGFRRVLRRHGAAAIPPIHYYRVEAPVELDVRAALASLTSRDDGRPSYESPAARGRYAIRTLAAQGHDFMGQFVVAPNGTVERIQTERTATGVKRFFTAGVTGLERKLERGREPAAADYAWAAVDVALPVALFKLARFTRAGQASRATPRTGRRIASRSARTGPTGLKLVRDGAKVGIVAGAAYVVSNPSVVNSLGHKLAQWLDWPVWVTRLALWFLLALPAILLAWLAWATLGRPLARFGGLLLLHASRTSTGRRGRPGAGLPRLRE